MLLACALALVPVAAPAERAVPALHARVTDEARLLPPERAARLEQTLARFEQETTHQLAVLTVAGLEGETIEAFSLRAAEQWKLGRRDADNGVLIVVAPNERRARIEVGYGLEGALPDALASRILRQRMTPRFAQGDYAGGIEAGVDAVMAALRGEVLPAAPPARGGSPHEDTLASLLFAGVAAMLLSSPLRRRRGLAALAGGGVGGGLCWLLLASLGWAAAGALLGALLGALGPAGLGGPGGMRGRRGVFLPGGFGGGGFGRGGFGGGGFGGGGGGFGGGGASGSW